MSNDHFKATARTLASHLDTAGISYDVYSLLNLTDALVGQSFIDPSIPTPAQSHDERVLRAVQSETVMRHMHDNKKINAIKELRLLTSCGLKEAKDAVEDSRVDSASYRFKDWDEKYQWYRIDSLDWLS